MSFIKFTELYFKEILEAKSIPKSIMDAAEIIQITYDGGGNIAELYKGALESAGRGSTKTPPIAKIMPLFALWKELVVDGEKVKSEDNV